MATDPACVACGFTLRWVPAQTLWGCDRCGASYPAARPEPYSPYPHTIKDTLPAGEAAGNVARRRQTVLWLALAVVVSAGVVVAAVAYKQSQRTDHPAQVAAAQVAAPAAQVAPPPAATVDAAAPDAVDAAEPPDAAELADAEADAPTPARPQPPTQAPTQAQPSTLTGMPNCDKYRALILRLSQCPKLPKQSRDALKQAYEQTSKGWAALPEASRKMVDDGCRQGNAAMQQSLSSYCQ